MSNVRQVRVTRPDPMPKLRPMRDTIPFTALESGLSRSARGNGTFRHVESVDKRTGFVWAVTDGRVPTKVNKAGNFVCDTPTSAPNADDLRSPDARDQHGYVSTRPLVRDEVTGLQTSARRVRTVADGDAPLKGIKSADLRRDGAKPKPARKPRQSSAKLSGEERPQVTRTTKSDVELFAAAHGIPASKLSDKRVVAAIRDLIAHRASVAAYAAK